MEDDLEVLKKHPQVDVDMITGTLEAFSCDWEDLWKTRWRTEVLALAVGSVVRACFIILFSVEENQTNPQIPGYKNKEKHFFVLFLKSAEFTSCS